MTFISYKSWLNENKKLTITIDGKKLPIQIIGKENWPDGKNDPTEYSSDSNIVNVREDYDYKKDPIGWMRHELVHYLLDQKGFKDDGNEYPYNAAERKAYSYQFKYLKKLGHKNIEQIPGLGKDKYIKILKKYWNGV